MILVPDLADIVRYADSDAERLVARLLRSISAPDGAVAFHSVKLRSARRKQQAEADFIVLWRGVVILIEVKGGGVRKHEGTWYSVDRRGDWNKLKESPMEQARSAMYALEDILAEDGIGWFPHESIVITPDVDPPPPSVEWKSTHWLSRPDMTIANLVSAFDAVAAGTSAPPPRIKLASQKALRERLFGHFTLVPVVDALRGAVLEDQNRATEEQARVLASLDRNQRIMVLGGAGTGKSLVLAESAKQEAELGRSVLITFYSPGLTRFFQPLIDGRKIDLISFGELPQGRSWDVVLTDEAQDLMNAEAMDRLDSVIKNGRSAGRWRMFLDPNNQAHVDGQFDSDILELVSAESISFDLSRNIRNTKAIVHVVQEYLGADIGDPGIVHGDRIQWHWTDGHPDVDAAVEVARRLIEHGVDRSTTWIICASSSSEPTSTRDGITVTSPRYAKGLEAECVIVCDLPTQFDETGIAAFYVAVTRARVSLHIVASADDKKRLQQLTSERASLK
ncbi:NERD domain-containing protein [Mycolicibacterium sp. 050232]|uniref:nuclease-related domain-containing DEAD/DEAH box helicase n=1 Tax=Mycolicibacterium sp. 050232 TaxID=3113982 RepID=UPI002E27D9EE|nr:NERD domain-containing protein [Mycolicibacterium sp. 050232]MED5812895.1 NERD domain-containing protein [Mycolicibacterium sp. 050232]